MASTAELRQVVIDILQRCTIDCDEHVHPVLLSLVARDLLPSTPLREAEQLINKFLNDSPRHAKITCRDFVEWLTCDGDTAGIKANGPAVRADSPDTGCQIDSLAAVMCDDQASQPASLQLSEEAAQLLCQLRETLEARPWLESEGSAFTHPLNHWVQCCRQCLNDGRYEEAVLHFERISNGLQEDEKKIAAAFKHFDKDGSGALSRTEFVFMCSYLGWDIDEAHAMDENHNGTVTLPEFQSFVGRLGGVQRFFEQRRQRVAESRKDICPMAGVEVGARVRAHFYQAGTRSRSWREAQVLAVNVGGCPDVLGNDGVLLEFGFDEARSTCMWKARQVVPPSWILSDLDETDIASACREVGILDDKQALWSSLFPMSELRAIQQLVGCQRAALAHIRQQATRNHELALPKLRERFQNLGFGEYELQAVLSWVKDLAPMVVHIHIHKVGQFLETDEFYRNQFETKTSSGSLDDKNETRTGWEKKLFGDAYKDAKPFDRCKYGALNVANDYKGVPRASQYGDSYLVLKDARLRATFCAVDSGGIESQRLGLCDRYGHVLKEYKDAELRELIRVAVAAIPTQSTPSTSLRWDCWPKVLRGKSEDPVTEWITAGYPSLAQTTGCFYYELHITSIKSGSSLQVGVLSDVFKKRLGIASTTGVGDDEHGWALDLDRMELLHGGMATCWEVKGLAKEVEAIGVAVDLGRSRIWFSVNGRWQDAPAFDSDQVPAGIPLFPAVSLKGRASFVFSGFVHPPPDDMQMSSWPKTWPGHFRVDCPRVGYEESFNTYKEFQLHGELSLKKHVVRLVANEKYREQPKSKRKGTLTVSHAGSCNGTYKRVGSYNQSPLFRNSGKGSKGWIWWEKSSAMWCMREEVTVDGFIVGDVVLAKYQDDRIYSAVVEEVLEDGTYKVAWDDGDTQDTIKSKIQMSKVMLPEEFQDGVSFCFRAPPDSVLGRSAPPVGGWRGLADQYGCVSQVVFETVMTMIGISREVCECMRESLQGTALDGSEVVFRNPQPLVSDSSFDNLLAKTTDVHIDAPTAWQRMFEEAQGQFLQSKGIPKDYAIVETPHPYAAARHRWTKNIKFTGAPGLQFIFAKECVTYDKNAVLTVHSNGLCHANAGPGARVEVSGLDGKRRFGTLVSLEGQVRKVLLDARQDGQEITETYSGCCWEVDCQLELFVRNDLDAVHGSGSNKHGSFTVTGNKSMDDFGKPIGYELIVVNKHGDWPVSLRWDTAMQRLEGKDVKQGATASFHLDASTAKVEKEVEDVSDEVEEFALAVQEPHRVTVVYTDGKRPGDEISAFRLDKTQPLAPVVVAGLLPGTGLAWEAGVREHWRLDLTNTFLGPSKQFFMALEGEGFGEPPKSIEDIWANLDGVFLRLERLLTTTHPDAVADETITLFFVDALPHRLVPEVHVSHSDGMKIDDELDLSQAKGDRLIVTEITKPGPAYRAGVRVNWELSLDKTLQANPALAANAEESLPITFEALLAHTGIKWVFILRDAHPKQHFKGSGTQFSSFEIPGEAAVISFETDGDGSASPDKRWGVAMLVMPSGMSPQLEIDESITYWRYEPDNSKVIAIRKEPAIDSERAEQSIAPGSQVAVSEEIVGEDGVVYLKLADGRGWIFDRKPGVHLCVKLPSHIKYWSQVIDGLQELRKKTLGWGHDLPTVQQDDWNETRLRSLCDRHGWQFEWLSEDGERRKRGKERQKKVEAASMFKKCDTACPDGFQATSSLQPEAEEVSNGEACPLPDGPSGGVKRKDQIHSDSDSDSDSSEAADSSDPKASDGN